MAVISRKPDRPTQLLDAISWYGDRLDSLEEQTMPAIRRVPVPVPAPAVVVSRFQAGHGYTNNAGGSANLNDTTDFALGTQAVSCVTAGDGVTAKTIKKLAFTAVDLTGRVPRVMLKCDNPDTAYSGVQIWLGDATLANGWKWELSTAVAFPYITQGVWQWVTLAWSDAIAVGTPPAKSAVVSAQLRVVDAGVATTTHINAIDAVADASALWPNGVVSLTFDDTYASHYTQAKSYMDKYGFAGSAYVIQDMIARSGRMTLAQLHQLEQYSGWEVCGHCTTDQLHSNRLTSINADALEDEMQAQHAFLRQNGFRGDTTAYPGGAFNADVLAAIRSRFGAARTIYQNNESLPPADRHLLRCKAYVNSQPLPATLTAMIDNAFANKEWLIFTFHDIVTTPVVSTDYSIASFQTVIDYLNTKGIAVRPVGDVLSGAAT